MKSRADSPTTPSNLPQSTDASDPTSLGSPLRRTAEFVPRPLKTLIRALFGPAESWSVAKRSRQASGDIASRLQEALHRVSQETRQCEEQPIFLLSAGWRSGSTLLQRMLMEHNRDVLIWGEPFDHSNIHDCMANQFRPFTKQWPFERFFLSKLSGRNLSDEWVANLYPDIDYLFKAHRRFFDVLFGEPARAAGRSRWGLKEVRLTIDHAMYFRALYPKCKILFLYRNPHDAYLSFRRLEARWFRSWPDDLVKTPYAFGRHWANTTRGFLGGYHKVDGLVIRYEDLDNPMEADRVATYLGWPISRSSHLQRRDISESQEKHDPLPRLDRALLDFATGKIRTDAGY